MRGTFADKEKKKEKKKAKTMEQAAAAANKKPGQVRQIIPCMELGGEGERAGADWCVHWIRFLCGNNLKYLRHTYWRFS